MTRIAALAALAAVQPDDVVPLVDVHDGSMAPTGTTKQVTVRNLLGRTAAVLPSGWDIQWRAAKDAALAGAGTAKIAVIGDSIVAGQSSGTVTDCLLYGFAGRLDALLATSLGGYAEGYTMGGLQPGQGLITAPSSPYSSPAGSTTFADGGIGQTWSANTTGSTYLTITAPVHPVTGANPVSMDILTVDFNTNTWQYAVDGGAPVTVTPASGTPPNGVNGTVGQGILRRTSIAFTGNTTHTVAVQANAANALMLCGHVTYYGTAGLAIMRNGIPGWRAVDFATGGGTTASSTGSNSMTPDHIIPWSGANPSTTPANNNIYASAAAGFPFNCDLGIIHIGGNDCTTGTSAEAVRKAVTRMIHAFRRAVPASGSTPGTSVLILGAPYYSEYSDNPSAGQTGYEWQRYKDILRGLAASYGCGWIDLEEVFGETPAARGLVASGQVHPTQNGAGAGGGDGHLLIAQTVYGVLLWRSPRRRARRPGRAPRRRPCSPIPVTTARRCSSAPGRPARRRGRWSPSRCRGTTPRAWMSRPSRRSPTA